MIARHSLRALVLLSAFALAFLAAAPVQAQIKYKGKKVEILDPGKLYSTYNLDPEELDELYAQGFSEQQVEHIGKMSHEDYWPAKMAELDSRLDNRTTIKEYTVYRIGYLKEQSPDKSILWVRAKKNKKMPAGFAPKEDFFIIIGDLGIVQ